MPKTIGKYEILNPLGSGAMGVVYLARDPIIDRIVAIKVLSPSLVENARQRERFYQEARTAGKLRHPNIVVIFDCGEDQGVPYIVMEYLEGEDLRDLIGGELAWSLERKLDFIGQICRGLGHAHQKNVVHRDVKPGNMRVLPDGSAKIMDFGIARLSDSTQTQSGAILGTVAYMAPEQCQSSTITAATDIWSVGVVLFELLTGRRPFEADNNIAVIHKIVTDNPPPLSRYLPNCSPELEQLVGRALAKDPATRYQRVDDLLADIENLLLKIRLEGPSESPLTVPGRPMPDRPVETPPDAAAQNSIQMTREVHQAAACIETGKYEEAENLIDHLSKTDVDSLIVTSLRASLERKREQPRSAVVVAEDSGQEVAPKPVRAQPRESVKTHAAPADFSIVEPEPISRPVPGQPPPAIPDKIVRRRSAETAVDLPKSREIAPAPEPPNGTTVLAHEGPAAPPIPAPRLTSVTGVPAARPGHRRLFAILAGVVVLAVIGFALYRMLPSRTAEINQPPMPDAGQTTVMPAQVTQSVSLNVLPWAEILEVTEKSSGRKVPELRGRFTPIHLNLPSGEYVFRVRNRAIAQELSFSIPVTSQGPSEWIKSFPEFDPKAAVAEFGIR
ncbi:MAG: serine/threonine protein kinase [Acidobacteria bacterium]|nr:MAG: serine/threonine protein kinase [Acidobacteriota bacterium]